MTCPDCHAALNHTFGTIADSHVSVRGGTLALKPGAKRPERAATFYACPACEYVVEFLGDAVSYAGVGFTKHTDGVWRRA